MSKRNRASGNLPTQRPEPPPPVEETLIRREMVSHNGPLPLATEFQHYDEILPGAAERIMVMAEQNAAHRRHREITNDRSMAFERIFSRAAALIFALAALGSAVWCATLGLEAATIAIGGVTIGGVVSAFIFGPKQKP